MRPAHGGAVTGNAADAVRAALAERQPDELARALGCSLAAVRAWRDGWRQAAYHVDLAIAALERGRRRTAPDAAGLRAEMSAADWIVEELAAALGVSRRTVIRWRTGAAPMPTWIGLSLSEATLRRNTAHIAGFE